MSASSSLNTLNLANDVILGKKTVAQARKEFGEAVVQRTLGKNPPITAALQFRPQTLTNAADREAISIAGAPQRADASVTGDGEILGALVALDLDEVHAASTAEMKKIGAPVMAFAKKLHEAHGQNVKDTTEVGQALKITAVQSPAARARHDKNAGELAKLVPLDGDAFARGFVDMMVMGHNETLQLLDKQLAMAKAEGLKAHLTKTRAAVAMHLQEAQQLQLGSTMKTSRR